jgi:C_GCAxxG_C_C family probable redox protein
MNMEKTDLAIDLFNSGFNCAQSVFSVFSEEYGLPQETALKISCGLGGGVRSGEICGAVSGAVMVIGLKNGQFVQNDLKAKDLCYSETIEFLNQFRQRNKSTVCRELLGVDISKGDGREQAANRNLVNTVCSGMIVSAIEILEDMGY